MDGSTEADQVNAGCRDLRPGDAVGPYELLYHAAEGGMAAIWAARLKGARDFQQLVAVKLLLDVLRDEPDARAMFLDEARTAARITHPNVAQVLDYGQERGRPYMAMEWLEGESLARIASAQRARGGRLPLRWVLHVAAAACAGLHAAHEARDDDGELLHLVHRDVSPQNVMVTFHGITKVVDFGVAKSRRRTQVTGVGVIKGKTGYFSPEQIRGAELDRRSDLFSFGIVLYLLTTDHHPFRGRSAFQTIQNIASREARSPRELVPEMPEALASLILRALARDPAARFQTAAELQRELERVSVSMGGRLTDKEVGAIARGLLPGAAAVRRERLALAAERLEARESGAARLSQEPTAVMIGSRTQAAAVGSRTQATAVGSRTQAAAIGSRTQATAVGSRTQAAVGSPAQAAAVGSPAQAAAVGSPAQTAWAGEESTWTVPVRRALGVASAPPSPPARAAGAERAGIGGAPGRPERRAPASGAPAVNERLLPGGPPSSTPRATSFAPSSALPPRRLAWTTPLAAATALVLLAAAALPAYTSRPSAQAAGAPELARTLPRRTYPSPPRLPPDEVTPARSVMPPVASRPTGWPEPVPPQTQSPRRPARSASAASKASPARTYNPDTL